MIPVLVMILLQLICHPINDGLAILFYPNPVKDILTFSLQNNAPKTCNISLYNLNGEIIFNSNSSKGQINMSNLASGIYVLSYRNNEGVFHHKLIKQ
jgi:bacillolysin